MDIKKLRKLISERNTAEKNLLDVDEDVQWVHNKMVPVNHFVVTLKDRIFLKAVVYK